MSRGGKKNNGAGDAVKDTVKRLSRYGRVAGTAAGLAARLAGERYLGLGIEREDHARQLTQALGNLKGPLMKIGQILATVPEALPPEYAQAFQGLHASAPPMGWLFVKRRMRAELGPDWEKKFQSFEHEASAAASLGQVHKAKSKNGGILACKLQYPDMRSAIAADLSQLRILFALYESYDKAIKTDHIHAELSERLYEELDYRREAKYCRLYGRMLEAEPDVHVPEIVESLSTDRLLTATWLEGRSILEFRDSSAKTRNRIAMNMFRAWYVPLYRYGVIHGDPHLGNYSVREDLAINLMDFGCVRVFKSAFIGGVIDLYHSLQTGDESLAVHAYETWGFKGLSRDHIDTLNVWARFLYAPVLDDRVRPIGEVKGGVYGREIAAEVHNRLREIGRREGAVAVPREFVFMDRAALGLGSVFLHLRAEINWHRVFNELIEGFDPKVLRKTQDKALKAFGLA